MMIDKRYARSAVLRLKCLGGWLESLSGKELLDELTLAAEAAASETVIMTVIDEWIAQEPKLPTPADLRRIVWAYNEKHDDAEQKPGKCHICAGTGYRTQWVLVTYRGSTLHVKKAEWMPFGNYPEAMRFARQLAASASTERQQLLSASIKCQCQTTVISCASCRDCGYVGGIIGGKYGGQWRWCTCATARRRRESEPNLVEDANRERETLLRIRKTKAVGVQSIADILGSILEDSRLAGDPEKGIC